MRRTLLTTLAAVLVTSTAACSSGGTSTASVRSKIEAQLVEQGLDASGAKCFAGVLIDEVGAKRLRDVKFSADAPPAGMEDEFAAAAASALTTCKIDVDRLNG